MRAQPRSAWAAGLGLDRLGIGPLNLGATGHLVRTRLGVSLRRPTLVRVHDLSGGNPFFAMELSRALAARGDVPATGPLPVPGTLADLVRDRIAALPDATQTALLFVAAAGRPTPETLAAAMGEAPDVALRPALDAGVVVGHDDGAVSSRTRCSPPWLTGTLLRLSVGTFMPRSRPRWGAWRSAPATLR